MCRHFVAASVDSAFTTNLKTSGVTLAVTPKWTRTRAAQVTAAIPDPTLARPLSRSPSFSPRRVKASGFGQQSEARS